MSSDELKKKKGKSPKQPKIDHWKRTGKAQRERKRDNPQRSSRVERFTWDSIQKKTVFYVFFCFESGFLSIMF